MDKRIAYAAQEGHIDFTNQRVRYYVLTGTKTGSVDSG